MSRTAWNVLSKSKKLGQGVIRPHCELVLRHTRAGRWKQAIPTGVTLCLRGRHHVVVEYAGDGHVHHHPDLYGATLSVEEWAALQGIPKGATERVCVIIVDQSKDISGVTIMTRHHVPLFVFDFMALDQCIMPPTMVNHTTGPAKALSWIMHVEPEPMDISAEDNKDEDNAGGQCIEDPCGFCGAHGHDSDNDDASEAEYAWSQGDPEILRHIRNNARERMYTEEDDRVVVAMPPVKSHFFDGPDSVVQDNHLGSVMRSNGNAVSYSVVSSNLDKKNHLAYGHGELERISRTSRNKKRKRITLGKHHRDAIWLDHYGVDATTMCGICSEHKINRDGTDKNMGHVVAYGAGGAAHQQHNFFYQCTRCNTRGKKDSNMFDQLMGESPVGTGPPPPLGERPLLRGNSLCS